MKKVILLSLICCFFLNCKAQVTDLNDFYRPGVVWGGEWYSVSGGSHSRVYEIASDTIIAGQTFHLINYVQAGVANQFIGGIRVDGQKVYYLNLSSDTVYSVNNSFAPGVEYLFYDYSIKVDDTLTWKPYNNVVLRIDTVNFNGSLLRRYFFSQVVGNYYDYWIEGMGTNLGFFGSYGLPFYPYSTFERTNVYCANNSQYKYEHNPTNDLYDGKCGLKSLGVNALKPDDAVSLFPNPSRNNVYLKSESSTLSEAIVYDLQGRQIHQQKFAAGTAQAQIQTDLHPGAYLVRITLGNGMITTRRLVRY